MNFTIELKRVPYDIIFSFEQSDSEVSSILEKYNISYENLKPFAKYSDSDGSVYVFENGHSLIRINHLPELNNILSLIRILAGFIKSYLKIKTNSNKRIRSKDIEKEFLEIYEQQKVIS